MKSDQATRMESMRTTGGQTSQKYNETISKMKRFDEQSISHKKLPTEQPIEFSLNLDTYAMSSQSMSRIAEACVITNTRSARKHGVF